MSDIVNKLIEDKIKKFTSFWKDYCNLRKIPVDFKTYLNYKSNPKQYTPDAYLHLYRAPLDFLVSSKSFLQLYYSLDKDFKDDLFDEEELKRHTLQLYTNKSLQQIIKNYLDVEDCIW